MRQWFQNVMAQVNKLRKNRSASQPQRRARLELEGLEDRLVPKAADDRDSSLAWRHTSLPDSRCRPLCGLSATRGDTGRLARSPALSH